MTNQQRKQVILMHNQGYSYAQLAEYFEVNRSTIRDIIRKHEAKYGVKQ